MAQGAGSPVFEHGRDFNAPAAAQGAHPLFQTPAAEAALEGADLEGAAAMELAEDLCFHARVVTSGRVAQLHEAVGTEFDAWGQSGHQRTAEGGHVVGSHPAAERDDLGAEERGVENLFDRADLVWGDVAERSWPQDDAGEAALDHWHQHQSPRLCFRSEFSRYAIGQLARYRWRQGDLYVALDHGWASGASSMRGCKFGPRSLMPSAVARKRST